MYTYMRERLYEVSIGFPSDKGGGRDSLLMFVEQGKRSLQKTFLSLLYPPRLRC